MAVGITAFFIGAIMTVQVSDRLSQLYVGNGANTRFDFMFRAYEQEDETGIGVRVKVGNEFEFIDESEYAVTLNPDDMGGYVTFVIPPSAETFFYIAGKTPVDQLLDITNYDNFYPDALERALDKITAILQEWNHLVDFETQARILADIAYDDLAKQREADLKAYIDGVASAITGRPVVGLPAHFVIDGDKSQKEINSEQTVINDGLTYREIHLSRLGAKFDGSDETSILVQAFNLADNNTTIVFDGPSFLFSSVDFGSKTVSLRGVPSISAQTLASVVKISGAGIVCNTQQVKIAYIDFQSTGTKSDGLNICLLTNNKNNGVWLHVANCRASGFSGHVLYSKDLIDSKISGFVPDYNNVVFKFVRDVWANNTTIQLEKVYAQQNTLLFDADYCTQSSMIDCIFEYNTSMGHINNGVWTIFNLYTENNYAPLIATNTRLLEQYHFAYTGNDIIVVTQPELAYIDKGTSAYTPRKADIFELEKSYERYKSIAPSFNGQTWTKLGTAALGEAGSLVLEVIGNNGYSQDTPSASSALGKTTIFAQVKNNNNASYANIQATWHHEGSASGIAEVRFVQTSSNRYTYDVYVLQNSLAYIGVGVSVNKADAFVWDIQRSVPKPTGGGSGDVNTPTMLIAYPYYKVGAGTGYFGSDGTNPILGGVSATTVGATGAAAALPANPVGYLTVNINGTNYKMPYYNT